MQSFAEDLLDRAGSIAPGGPGGVAIDIGASLSGFMDFAARPAHCGIDKAAALRRGWLGPVVTSF